jgi:hypothetical protein
MSTYDGRKISALDSFTHYREELRLEASGTMAISTQDCSAEKLGVDFDGKGFPSHVSIDFTGHPERDWKSISKRLKASAAKRGWQVGPVE